MKLFRAHGVADVVFDGKTSDATLHLGSTVTVQSSCIAHHSGSPLKVSTSLQYYQRTLFATHLAIQSCMQLAPHLRTLSAQSIQRSYHRLCPFVLASLLPCYPLLALFEPPHDALLAASSFPPVKVPKPLEWASPGYLLHPPLLPS